MQLLSMHRLWSAIQAAIFPFCSSPLSGSEISTHLKLCLADAIHNFKREKIVQIAYIYYEADTLIFVDTTRAGANNRVSIFYNHDSRWQY